MKIALIALSALENLAIRQIVTGFRKTETVTAGSLTELQTFDTECDTYVVNVEEYILHPDFFMPRREKVAVITPGQEPASTQHLSSIPRIIFRNSDEATIEEILESLCKDAKSLQPPSAELSQREKDVIRVLAKGLSNKEIAEELCISVNTVITHRKNITSKLGIKSASALAIYALMNGII